MLEVDGLRTGYRGRPAVFDASLSVAEGEIVALVGHNGAGKTTTLKSVVGLLPAWQGGVRFREEDISRSRAADNVRRGLCFLPEDDFVFTDLTVEDNLTLARFGVGSQGRASRDADAVRAEIFEVLPVLRERSKQRAGTLSGGERRMLSIGMALAAEPRMLLVDEPSLGLAPVLVERVMDLLAELVRRKGLSVLMVEQNVDQALRIADRCYVMRAGRIVMEESAARLAARDQWWDLF
ncbi:MAG: ATP-binding cassette domain-containing protein [Streptosporangiales bacterium]|nr:ATP-binding cassette domain-containing protein [Streptosporangiales bacterium]